MKGQLVYQGLRHLMARTGLPVICLFMRTTNRVVLVEQRLMTPVTRFQRTKWPKVTSRPFSKKSINSVWVRTAPFFSARYIYAYVGACFFDQLSSIARTRRKPSGTFRGQKDCSGELTFVPPQDFDRSPVVGEIASSKHYHIPVCLLHHPLMLRVY